MIPNFPEEDAMLFALTRTMMVAVALVVIFLMIASPALAQNGNGDNQGNNNGNNDNQGNDDGGRKNNGGDPPVPEIDPASAVSGVILLTGSMMLLADSRRRKK